MLWAEGASRHPTLVVGGSSDPRTATHTTLCDRGEGQGIADVWQVPITLVIPRSTLVSPSRPRKRSRTCTHFLAFPVVRSCAQRCSHKAMGPGSRLEM